MGYHLFTGVGGGGVWYTYRFEETYILPESAQTAEEGEAEGDAAGQTHQDGRVEEDIQGVAYLLVLLDHDPESGRRDDRSHQLQARGKAKRIRTYSLSLP